MSSIRTRARRALTTAALAATAATASAAPSLVGDTIYRVGQPQWTGVVSAPEYAIVTDPGQEFADVGLGITVRRFNVGPSSIRMEADISHNDPWFDTGNPPSYVEFRDLDFDVPGMVIGAVEVSWSRGLIAPEWNAPADYPAFGAHAVIFNADTVRLYTGPYQFEVGAWVQIDLIPIPTPSAAVLAGLGLLAAGRRRR